MAGIYRAELFCDDCVREIAKDLAVREEFPPYLTMEERIAISVHKGDTVAAGLGRFDSEDWPSWGYPDDEPSDSIHHCGSGSECLNKIDLYDYGLGESDSLYGAQSNYVGAIVSGLTNDGAAYTLETIRESGSTPYQRAVHRLWEERFDRVLSIVRLGED